MFKTYPNAVIYSVVTDIDKYYNMFGEGTPAVLVNYHVNVNEVSNNNETESIYADSIICTECSYIVDYKFDSTRYDTPYGYAIIMSLDEYREMEGYKLEFNLKDAYYINYNMIWSLLCKHTSYHKKAFKERVINMFGPNSIITVKWDYIEREVCIELLKQFPQSNTMLSILNIIK